MIRVTIYNEYRHEKTEEAVRQVYPNGIHNAIADFLRCDDIEVKTVTLDDPDCGITDELLDNTDVLIWWGHIAHHEVPDAVVAKVRDAVLKGMGMLFLHSGHHSKPFKALMGTTCNLSWREDGAYERVWVIDPSHPITQGIDKFIFLEHEEMYGEPFGIPEPEKLLFIGAYESGEVFRSGCLYQRGNGKIFYFQPGHETYPTYYNKDVQTVIRNAVRYLVPLYREKELICPWVPRIDGK